MVTTNLTDDSCHIQATYIVKLIMYGFLLAYDNHRKSDPININFEL